jgi:hypothetical protein
MVLPVMLLAEVAWLRIAASLGRLTLVHPAVVCRPSGHNHF